MSENEIRVRHFVAVRRKPERRPLRPIVQQLVELRVNRGVSIRQLAREAGYDKSVVMRVEAGYRQPSVAYLEDAANVLKASLVLA